MVKTIKFERSITSDNPMRAQEYESVERILARLVAAAFASDHPELFADTRRGVHIMGSRPEQSARSLSGTDKQEIDTAGGIHAHVE